MDNFYIFLSLVLLLLPVFFAFGWFAARIDLNTLIKHAKSVPDGLYKAIDALIDNKTSIAAQELNEVVEQNKLDNSSNVTKYELVLSLGRLYRQRGENNKAILLHQRLLNEPDLNKEQLHRLQFELGKDFQSAGLVDRAEREFEQLSETTMAKDANELLLYIYQQDRDWQKAINTAGKLSHDAKTYQFEIAQFYCELAQASLFRSDENAAIDYIQSALNANRKCTRANMLLGDVAVKQGRFQDAIDAYLKIEQQNHEYLGMVGERIYDAFASLGQANQGLDVLIGYIKTFPQLDLLSIIYDKSLVLYGEEYAMETLLSLVRATPNLIGVYQLLGIKMSNINPLWRADTDMMRTVIGRHVQKSLMYRCRQCYFKSQVFFWHCPACNRWETFTPNRIEI
ncbi:MAG: lipopolysaccharide assembly protein LapB [Neisseriaceae bacterium]|nr:lipopolysaccharide assembly protein LapB [Neisseriaceae bacterium]